MMGLPISGINTAGVLTVCKEGVTAPEGAGPLRRVRPDHSLRNVDRDLDLIGLDHDAETGRTVLNADHYDPNTSYRDGSESAGMESATDSGLPANRRWPLSGEHIIKLSLTANATVGRNRIITNCAALGGARRHNGQLPFNFGMSHLDHGDCPPLFLNQYRQASTACERFAKTLDWICSSIQSISSCSTVTLIRGLFSTIKYDSIISEIINIGGINVTIIGLNPIGVTTNARKQPISGSSDTTEHNKVRDHPVGRTLHTDRVSDTAGPRHNTGPSDAQTGDGSIIDDAPGRLCDRLRPLWGIPMKGNGERSASEASS